MTAIYRTLSLVTIFSLATTLRVWAQCETAPLEGYRGKCDITAVVSKDGKYTYTSNGEAIKKWNFASKSVEAEWPVENKVTQIIGVSDNGKYIRYRNGDRSFNLFDTEKGSKVVIDGNEVLDIIDNLNIAVLSEVKSRTANMIKSYYTKAVAYDMKTGKRKTLAEFRNYEIAESSGRIALNNNDDVTIFDLATGKLLYSFTIITFEKSFGLSPDGNYVAWNAGVVDLSTKKLTSLKTDYDNNGALYIFSPDSKSLYFMQRAQFHQYVWHYGFAKVQKYDWMSGTMTNDFSKSWLNSLKEMDQAYSVFPAANNQFYIFDGKTVALTSEESIDTKSDVLDLYGNIGSGGQAQIAKEEAEKARLATLRENMIPKFEALRETEGFYFPYGNHLHLLDFDSETGLLLVGDVFQSGLFKMPEGTLIQGFGPNPGKMRLGPPAKQVKTNINTVSGAVSPNGEYIAFGGDGVAELYHNGKFVKRFDDLIFKKILDDRRAIVSIISEKKMALYDFQEGKIIVNYGRGDWACMLSPDKTKLLRDSKVFDVQSGKVLLDPKRDLMGLTNKYAVMYNTEKPALIDISSGKEVEAEGWDPKKHKGKLFVSGNFAVTSVADGPMYVYDIDNKKYVSEQPVLNISDNVFEERAYFANTSNIFFLNDQGFATYGIKGLKAEVATAFSVNALSGEIYPYLFHEPRQVVAAANKKQEEANKPSPEVTDLLNTLRDLQPGFKFDYSNFEYLNLNANAVATRYFTFLGPDKVYGLGKFCSGFGVTKVLALIQKNPGPNEQYIFHLLHVGPKGILKNDILGFTQKVNGAVTELANLEITSNNGAKTIRITTEANGSTKTKEFGCY